MIKKKKKKSQAIGYVLLHGWRWSFEHIATGKQATRIVGVNAI
jgi:hypothetical protein